MIETNATESLSSQQQLGLLLQHAREKRNLAVNDIAAELKVLKSAVKALESGEYSAIKGRVFVKGYLLAYAKFLQLDVDECLALYHDNSSEKVVPAAAGIMDNAKQGTVVPKIILGLIAFVMAVLIIISLSSKGDESKATASLSASLKAKTHVAMAETDTLAETDAAFLEPEELLVESGLDNSDTPSVETPNANTPNANNVSAETSSLISGDTEVLSLVFTADCWVEVNDAAGEKLISDLKRDGERISLRGQPPYEVLLGYGPAVTINYQGKKIDFEVGENPTVKLLVGENI